MGDLLETTEAWRFVHSQESGTLDGESLLDQMLLAGYDENTAQQAATDRMKQRLRQGQSG
jgi:hypothetical protein